MKSTIPEGGFRDEDGFQAWLESLPEEQHLPFARALAHRAALRALPFVASAFEGRMEPDDAARLTSTVFRANAISRVAHKYPTREIADAARAAAYAARFTILADAAAITARNAVVAAYAVDAVSAVSAAADAAITARYAAITARYAVDAVDAVMWEAIAGDAQNLLERGTADGFEDIPLWPEGAPEWWMDQFKRLTGVLTEQGPNAPGLWSVWTAWYDAIVIGHSPWRLPRDKANEIEKRIALGDGRDDFWDTEKRSVAEINAEIAGWVEEARAAQSSSDQKAQIPELKPSSVQPEWAGDLLRQKGGSVESDFAAQLAANALKSVRDEMQELADEVENSGNVDCRAADYIRKTAVLIGDDLPDPALLFRLMRREATLADYAAMVKEQWPDFLASRYRTIGRDFSEALDQFPDRRKFRRHLLDIDVEELPITEIQEDTEHAIAILRDETGQSRVDESIPATIEMIGEDESSATGSAVLVRSADQLESVNSTLKMLAEHAFDDEKSKEIVRRINGVYAEGIVAGLEEGAREAGIADGKKLAATIARTNAATEAAKVGKKKLSEKYPRYFGWLDRMPW